MIIDIINIICIIIITCRFHYFYQYLKHNAAPRIPAMYSESRIDQDVNDVNRCKWLVSIQAAISI